MNEHNPDAQVIREITEQAMLDQHLLPAHIAAVPEHMKLQDLERYLPNARRKRGNLTVATAESLLIYVQKHGDADSLVVAHRADNRIVCSLDHHGSDPTAARHIQHAIALQLEHSPEYQAVLKVHDKALSQRDFCNWIEDYGDLVTKPDYADLLELARSLHAVKADSFTTHIDVTNGGTSVKVASEVAAKCGRDEVEFPRLMHLRAPVFYGEPADELQMRLRIRVMEGELRIHTAIARKDAVEESARGRIIDTVNAGIADLECPPVLLA